MPQDKKKQQDEFIDPFDQKKGQEFVDPFTKNEEEFVDPFQQGLISSTIKEIASRPTTQAIVSKLSPVFDVLARGQYASARFVDALAEDGSNILGAISEGFNELLPEKYAYGKQSKMSYSDVIRRRFPEYAINNPRATSVLGFIGDVALDPTSYLGIGLVKDGIQVGSKVLTGLGGKALRQGLEEASLKAFVGKAGTIELIEELPKAISKAEKTEGVLTKRLAKAEERGIDTVLATQGQVDRIINRNAIEKELTEQGYFDAVRSKQDEIEAFLNKLSGDPNVKLSKTIAKDETLQDLKRFGKERLPDELFKDEVRQRIEQRILRLTEVQPDIANKLFEGRGIFLKAGLPFGKQRDFLKLAGLEGLYNKVNALTAYIDSSKLAPVLEVGRQLRRAVDRDYGLDKEYITRRNDLDNYLQYVVGQTERDTLKLFKTTISDKDARERIQSALNWIDDQSRMMDSQLGRLGQALTDEQGAKIFQIGLKRFKLNENEKAIATMLRQDYADAMRVEMEADLLKNGLINYSPRGYEVIGDPNEFSLITRGKYNREGTPQVFLSSSHERKFKTNAEALAAGLQPELDAALLYAHRMLASRRSIAIKQFRDSIEEMYGTVSTKGTTAHTGVLPTKYTPSALPQKVVDDMRMIGEAIYPSGMSENGKYLLRLYDKLQTGLFKRPATVYRPSFATKQLFSNTFQSALVSGAKAFKALDPRVGIDAALLMFNKGVQHNHLPTFLNNFISKYFTGNQGLDGILASRVILSKITGDEQLMDFAKQFKLRSALGQEFTGEELVQLAREHGIIREIDSTGEQFSKKVLGELTTEKNTYKNVVGELSKFWKHAALVEDYSRMNLFLNGIRMGYSAEDATKLVNKALFDYQRGLSKVEKGLIKRIVPFYSFQRFALPFIFKQGLKQPGNPATIEKVVRTMEKLLVTGEPLNPSEANVFNEKGNNFVLEQGHLLTGFDKEGKANVNILNNLTPFDIVNFFVTDQDGNLDYEATAKKSIYGAMTPFIKMPISALADKDFFTDKTIAQASKLGNVEASLGQILPQFAKDAIGWEARYNEATGKTSVYANPFLAYYMMQVFPPLRDVIKGNENVDFDGGNPIMNAVRATMNTVIEASKPLKTQKLDLKEMSEYSMLKVQKEYNDLVTNVFSAKIRGSKSEEEEAMLQLQNLLKNIEVNQTIRNQFPIRGQGINPTGNPEAPTQRMEPSFK